MPNLNDSLVTWEDWANDTFHNGDMTDFADHMGKLAAKKAFYSERFEILKKYAKESGLDSIEGKNYEVTISLTIRKTLKKANVVKKLGQAWVNRNSSESQYYQVKVNARTDAGAKRKAA